MTKTGSQHSARQAPAGVALILVMLAILVLSVLAASIVFSARSEAFASYNYRISTQADYVAKSGLQKAVNFFNSDKYKPVAPPDATTYYDVSQYSSIPVVLYNSKVRPVNCIANCATANSAVVLSMDSSGNFNGNYPTPLTNADGDTIGTAFKNRFYAVAINPLSSAFDSGQFTVKATLEEYYTVNDAFYPALNPKPFEVWLIESTGTWNSNVGSAPRKPTSVQQATLAPVYLPFFANALYGMCNITLNGNVCTDSYNSKGGNYNAAAPQNCVTSAGTATNAFASGAGVGSGGGVTLNGGAYVVNGDVSYGATPPTYSSTWTCPSSTSGVTGSVTGVKGAVQPVPAIPEPPMPTFPSCAWYGGAAGTSCNKNISYPTPPNPTSPGNGEYVWVKQVSGQWYYETLLGGTTTDYQMGLPTWLATTTYSAGTVINAGNGHTFTVTSAGTSGTTAPSWPTTTASTVTDGGSWTAWAATTAYTVGQVRRPTTDNGHLYKCITAGTSGVTQPTFPTGSGATVNEPAYATWAANTSYAAGATLAPGNGHWYQVTTAGLSGASAPAWSTVSGATVTETLTTWSGHIAYTVGTIVKPTAAKLNGHRYRCTVAGTSGGGQPTWPTGAGATVVDSAPLTWAEAGSDVAVVWREGGVIAVLTWQEIGTSAPITWTESGTNTNIFGEGTSSDPFRLPALSVANNANLCLTGGPDASSIIYYDVEDFYSLGTVYIVNQASPPTTCPPAAGYTAYGFAAVNIYKTFTMGGPGVTQPAAAPPAALIINVYNQGVNSGSSVALKGQANLKAVVTALGDATLGGGGSGGAFYGSIIAGSVTDGGTYSVHYDQSLQVASGKLMPMTIRNYNRPKF